MARHQRLVHIASRKGAQDEDVHTEAVVIGTYTNMIAVGVAALGLLLTGLGGILQFVATQDQIKQSAEAEKSKREEQAALFDIHAQWKEDGRRELHLYNYSRHSVRRIEIFMTSSDPKQKKTYQVPLGTLGPCSKLTIPYESFKNADFDKGSRYGWRDVMYRDWEGGVLDSREQRRTDLGGGRGPVPAEEGNGLAHAER
ncbi:hypothetical protein ABZS86_34090 [Streptomyces sp. NPDC005355]|uniref:hypothetical protein n=1 Tax=Streptomyces sp. NPDC005355 TaxID=3157038 RepID=UPI0033A2ADED